MFIGRYFYVSFGGNGYIHNHKRIHPSPDMKCCYSVIKGMTVTQGVLDSHVGLLLLVLPVDGLLAYVSGCPQSGQRAGANSTTSLEELSHRNARTPPSSA